MKQRNRTRNIRSPSFEHQLLESLKPYFNFTPSKTYPLPVGDDAAVRQCCEETLVITADTMIEHVHFSFEYMSLQEVGFKAMAVNLSDCAAMGANADSALVQLIFPSKLHSPIQSIHQLYKGFRLACKKWNFPIIGGNMSRGPCWAIDITLIGKNSKRRVLKRTGVRQGDYLYVSGWPGCSSAGLAALCKWGKTAVPKKYLKLVRRHTTPTPRIELGLMLSDDPHVHAAIDLSDGISKECWTLCFENNLKLTLEPNRFPLHADMLGLAKELDIDPHQLFLHGGEDYELLFAASPKFIPEHIKKKTGIPITRIGWFSKGESKVFLQLNNSSLTLLKQKGWDHFRKNSSFNF